MTQEPFALGDPRLVSLDDPRALDGSLVGAKAAALARARQAGFAVPPAFVVVAGASMDELEPSLSAALAALGDGPFAVRSSATREDGAARSFAGQLESFLSVEPARVLDCVQRCQRSARSMRALVYGDPGAVAVLVQTMVAARCAGVAFSADPRSGERDCVCIDAAEGLGDRLVSGELVAESWRCVGDHASRVRSAASSVSVLDESLALSVAALARSMEKLFGAPQDVEWAHDGRCLSLLQSRPITALPAAPVAIEVVAPSGDWERDDHHAVLSPLGWDWFAPYPAAMGEAMRSLGIPIEAVRTTSVGGHLYLQMVMPGGPANPPRWLLWVVSRALPSMRRANRTLEDVFENETYLKDIDRWERELAPSLRASVSELFVEDPSTLSDRALLEKIRASLALCARGLILHAQLSSPTLFAVGKLQLFVADHLGWTGARVLDLLSGSSSSTTEVHRAIESLVREHHEELRALGELAPRWGALFDRAPRFAEALARWLRDNHLRVLHYDPKHATLGERPEVVLSIALAAIGARAAPEAREPAALSEARQALAAELRPEFERLLTHARRGYALRDENGIEAVSRPAGLLRWFVRELGRRLAPALEQPEHAVYLRVDEHEAALARAIPDLAARVARRRGEESWALRHRPPKRFGAAPAAMSGLDAFPPGLRKVLQIFDWMTRIEAGPERSDGAGLRGIGLGARVVTARARVIDDPSQLGALRFGEVLVCRITSPEWSVALGRAAAIVTDEGALLSHPAIIAREFEIPAVLATERATREIATGDLVRVDPVAATVTIVR